jgi:DNA invertase Pin-like site-specific DNA recombinase
MQAVGYIRTSTNAQLLAVEAQRNRIQQWCNEKGLELLFTFEDIGISGGSPLEKRPGILAAIDALQPGMTLIAVKRDRLARDTMYAAMLERLVVRKHATIRTCDGVGEGNSPESHMIKGVIDVFSDYERKVIAARTKVALTHLKQQGKRVSRYAPYGFQFTDENGLESIATEQLVITSARTYARKGLSLRKIASRLADSGYLSRTNMPFTAKAIRAIIQAT